MGSRFIREKNRDSEGKVISGFYIALIILGIFFFSSCFMKKKKEEHIAPFKWTIILYMSIDNVQFGSFPTDLWGNTERILTSLGEKSGARYPIILLYDGCRKGDSKIISLDQGRVIDDKGYVISENKEVNYGDPDTMARFIIWFSERFPAENYLLGLAHHYGWKGYNTDENSPGPLDMDIMTQAEHIKAMERVRDAGVMVNIIWFEACSITMLETLYQYAKDADYVVGNEDTIDFYEELTRPVRVIKAISRDEELSPEKLVKLLVDKVPLLTPSLISNQLTPYSFVLNPKAPGTKPELGRLFDLWQPTQFGFYSNGVMEVKEALDELAVYLIEHLDELKPDIQKARKQSKEYTLYPWYIDLFDFVDIIEKRSSDRMLKIFCINLKEKIIGAIVTHKKPKIARHYNGILIMFPISREEFLRETYNEFAPEFSYFDLRLSQEGKWDDFLLAYFGRK